MAILNGTNKADTILGTAQDDNIFGGNGNDRLDGGAGNDRLFGENGDDIVSGGAGNDFIDGGNGNDMLAGGAGDDDIQGGNGQDTLVLAGNRADFRFLAGSNGSVIVRDLRANGGEGTDRLFNMEQVKLADGTFKLSDLIQSNVAPVAQNDALTLAETAGKTEIGSILLANDSDADGDALVVSSVQAVSAQGAVVSIGPDGKVSYDAGSIFADLDNGETATDSFTYTITDGNGHVSTATATVTIVGVGQNGAPVAVNDKFALAEDAGATDITATLLLNDSDPDGDAIQVSSVQSVSNRGATVSVGPDGKVTYDAGQIFMDLEAGEKLTDSFTYTITDEHGVKSTATASVQIMGVTQQPDAYFYIEEDATREDLAELLSDWLDMPILGAEPMHGTLGTISFDEGVLSFAADHDFSDRLLPDQSHSTTFTVFGPEGQKKTIMAVVEGTNDQIVAVDDVFAVGEGETSVNLWKAVVANEIDPDGSIHSNRILSVGTEGTQGLVSFDASSRTLTYSAAGIDLAPGETMTDSFTYVVTDGWGSQDTATVIITVTGGPNGGASLAMAGGESIMSAFLPAGGGMSHLDDAEFASFPAIQEILVTDAVVA